MKTRKLAAIFAAAAVGSSTIPGSASAELLPAHRLDRIQKYEESFDITGDGSFTFEDVYYYYLGVVCDGRDFATYYNMPEEIEPAFTNATFVCSDLCFYDAAFLVEYYVDQNIASEADIDALYDTPVTYFDWKAGPIPTVNFRGETNPLDYSSFYKSLALEMKRDLKSSSIYARTEQRLKAMFDKISDGSLDLDLNCDGTVDTTDIACGDFFISYLKETAPDVLAGTERLGFDQLTSGNISSLLAPVSAYNENSGFSENVWNKCFTFLEGLTECGFDYRQFDSLMFLYGVDALDSFEDDLTDYCNELAAATGLDYAADVMEAVNWDRESARDVGMYYDMEHDFRYSTKLDQDFCDPDFGDNMDAASKAAEEGFEDGDISKLDVNNDGSLNFIDYFILEVYIDDQLMARGKDGSILPEDLWDRIDNDIDISGNGVSGDWCDVMTIERMVIMHGGDWDVDIEATIDSLFTSVEAREVVVTVMQSSVCKDREAGDVNLDGMVTAADASEVLGYYASCSVGGEAGTAESARLTLLGDLDNNGTVSAEDASAILGVYAQHSVE